MAMKVFTLPDLGEGLEEAEIVEWHVPQGERVVADQPLVSVETDKAVVEVPSPWSGIVVAQRASPGDILRVGDVLAEIDDGARADTGAIVGTLESIDEDRRGPVSRRPERPASPGTVLAAPAARALAAQRGIDLATVSGTGPGGIISRADIDRVSQGVHPRAGNAARRSMARAMARAHAQVVPATLTDVADITRWHGPDADVTVRLVRAICVASSAEPALNGWYDPDGTHGDPPEGVALGLAVDTPNGLYVPVLAQIDRMTPTQTRRQIDDATQRVHRRQAGIEGTVLPTISLSNFGPIGGRHAALVVTPPQIAILGAGRAYDAVAWRADEPCRAVHLPLSLTFDHRAVTGGEAARFMAAAVADLQLPEPEPEKP